MADDFRLDAPGFLGGLVVGGHRSTTRASLAAGRPARAHGTRPPTLYARDPFPRACLCRPLPLHARASDVTGADAKAVRDLELHAAAARAASRARRRRRGRFERPRLGALPQRPTDGRLPGSVVCVGGDPPPSGVMHPLVVQRLWRLWRRQWRLWRRLWRRRRAHRHTCHVRSVGTRGGSRVRVHRAACRLVATCRAAGDAPPERARSARAAPAAPHWYFKLRSLKSVMSPL